MNREIKFRAKVDEKGLDKFWEYGGIIHITEQYKDEEDFEKCDIWELINTDGVSFNVDKYTIGQYTGLKDKNGKEIYEGDIIQDEFYERKAEVVFLEGAFWLDYKEDFGVYNTKHKRYQLLANYDYEQVLEVIGNIYDNPELLEV